MFVCVHPPPPLKKSQLLPIPWICFLNVVAGSGPVFLMVAARVCHMFLNLKVPALDFAGHFLDLHGGCFL